MGLGEVDRLIRPLFDADAEVILYITFTRQLIVLLKTSDYFVNWAVLLGNNDDVVYIDYEYYVLFYVDTFIYFGLGEAYIREAFVEVGISYHASLFLSIKVLVEEEDMGLYIFFFQDCSWWEFHVKIKLYDCLWEYQHKVNFSCGPIVEEG